MAIFPCEYFLVSTKYPESGTRVQLGNSYTYTAPPPAADQRIFRLSLAGMQYFVNALGAIDLTQSVNRNMAVLEKFYNENKMHVPFDFNHPVYGVLKCKFNRPLDIPRGVPNGNGLLESFDVELLEIP